MYVYCRLRGRLAHERSLELLDVLCSLLIHKVLLANRSHWAKQKRQDHGGKDCPPPRGRLGGGTLSPKKPLRSEEVPGVRLSTLLRSGPLMEEFLTKRSRSVSNTVTRTGLNIGFQDCQTHRGGATRLSRESRAGSKPPTTEEAVGKPGVGRFRRKKCRRASPPQKQRAGDAPGLSRGGGWGAGGKLNSGWARNGSFFAPPSPSRLRRQRCLAPIGRGPWGKSWNQLVGKVGPKVQTRRARKAGEVETKTARLPRKSVPDLGRVQLRTGKQGSPSLTPQFPEAAGAWGFRCLSDPDHPDAQEEGHNPLRAADTRLSGLFHGAGGQWARLSEMIHALKPPGTEDPPSPLFRCA
uniref:Uncharacterized protein n=1 Tax=Rangifer tarandus platyrhynchus TaxID=3082113 RepID=A0ACB0DSG4_RANTA|nr:unnamed protein product [Rangifer tarandus platyrhynchus]